MSTATLLAAIGTAALVSLALLLPAKAQFWGDSWGGRQQRQQQQYNPFGGWGWGDRQWENRPQYRERERERERDTPVDYSRAPAATPRKDATTTIVVLGDAMADWLAYGLEDAYSEKTDIGIVRKHRTDSGLIRYDQRRDIEWSQAVREIIAAEKPKFIVMMVGNNDRQSIREKPPAVVRPATPPGAAKPAAPQAQPAAPVTPETKPPLDAELQRTEHQDNPEPPPVPTTEQGRLAAYGPWEFHTEKWEAAYIKRIDATIAAMKSAGVPVLWVGLPARSGAKATTDTSYLNELYRNRAEKAGITYVDIWDGFVDEQGRYTAQGPDYEGQTRRLRTGDGVYFTKYGARKLAHYVEREIERHIANRAVPVALPVPVEPTGPQAPGIKPGTPAQRPAAGPVLPLTAPVTAPEELLGGARGSARPAAVDPVASRVLTKGEPIAAPTGRADDFSWPRGKAADEPAAVTPAAMTAGQTKPGQPAATPMTDAQKAEAQQKLEAQKRARTMARESTREPAAPRQVNPFNPSGWFGGFGRW